MKLLTICCGCTSPPVVPGQTLGFICTRDAGHDGAHQAADPATDHGSVVWATWMGGRLLDGIRTNIDLGGCCPDCGLPNDDGDNAYCAACNAGRFLEEDR